MAFKRSNQTFVYESVTDLPTLCADGDMAFCMDTQLTYRYSTGTATWIPFGTSGGGGLTNPMTTAGDIIYENSTPAPARLAAGSATQVLHSGTTPSWSAVSLTADVTGVLPQANGGLGTTTGTGNTVLSDGATITNPVMNATTIVTDTTTGLKIGTATTQKLGFFNATPVVQQAAATDILVALASLGLRVSGSSAALSTTGIIQANGAFRTSQNSISANTTLAVGGTTATSYYSQICNATTAGFTVTLPATTTGGYRFTIKKIDSTANTVTISGTSIDGAASYVLSTQYKYVTLESSTTSGTWYIVSNN